MKKYLKWIDKDVIKAFGLFTNIGLTMIINIFVCIGLYKLIEMIYKPSTILFIILVILGVMSGFYSVYKLIMDK